MFVQAAALIGLLVLAATVIAAAGPPRQAPSISEGGAPPIPPEVLRRRRQALFQLLEPGIALIRSADRRASTHYPQDSHFRQNNDFYYLTGIETPESWLVLFKPERGVETAVLYVPEVEPEQTVWTGPQLGPGEEVERRTGIDRVRPTSRFRTEVLEPMRTRRTANDDGRLYLAMSSGSRGLEPIAELARGSGRSVVDLSGALARLRQVKDSAELTRLRKAIAITVEGQRRAMAVARPGLYEYQIEAVVEYVFQVRGAARVGFPTIVGSGPNSVVLHHDSNRRRIREGDLIVLDAGAEYGYYTADVTRTFPVSGRFTPRQRALYELVLAAQDAVIDSIRPGLTLWDLERIARRHLRDYSDGLCGETTCDRYFLHGVSHWLGMDVHDVAQYSSPLTPGMVLTVEPGIYLAEEDLGVRIEDDVLVTEEGVEVLSAAAPRTVEEIEALVGRAELPFEDR